MEERMAVRSVMERWVNFVTGKDEGKGHFWILTVTSEDLAVNK